MCCCAAPHLITYIGERFARLIQGYLDEAVAFFTDLGTLANWQKMFDAFGLGVLADLKAKKRPANMTPDLATIYDFVTQVTEKHEVSDATFAAATKLLGEQGVVDMVAHYGYYSTLAMLMNVARTPLPEGSEPGFKSLPG